MPSTLTSGVKDGKQSKKIERNTRKHKFIEILLLGVAVIVLMIARGLSTAQLENCADASLSAAMLKA
ncbi:hypothetical protein [Pseudomonas arsenicoxydans]|uniref:Uncharacterized protein n=1 Tax=Pseudomonas arsenicoxydans TaxID=702115 RepID=A0A502HPI1_9PSED|nr:hypothetical protein [Pseudomonas arsenicoxydans]TPG76729.1 hypothetical protein EAH78_16345 [Pseudomonas arsenicoxydans]